MRYLTPGFAAGALRRGKPIEQFLGPAFHGDRHGIRWVSIEPDRERLKFTVLHHLAEDAVEDGWFDIYELPPLDPEAYDLWPEVGTAGDPAEAMELARRETGAGPAYWTNFGIAADDYRDYANQARLPLPLARKDIVAVVKRLSTGGATGRVHGWLLDAVARQTGCVHFCELVLQPGVDAGPVAEHVLDCRPVSL